MNRPSVEIKRQQFIKVRVEANPAFDRSNPVKLETNSNMELHEVDGATGQFAAISKVTAGLEEGSAMPYLIDVEAYGEFVIQTPDQPIETNRAWAMNIAHQVLYASVREMIHTITARSVNGGVNIGVSFLTIDRKEADGQPDVKEGAPKRPSRHHKPKKKEATKKAR